MFAASCCSSPILPVYSRIATHTSLYNNGDEEDDDDDGGDNDDDDDNERPYCICCPNEWMNAG